MQVIPAIDLEGGRSRIVFWPGAAAGVGAPTDRPEAIAARFVELGAPAVHLVDFDGARAGTPRNLEAVSRVAAKVATPLQLAGGLEDPDAIRLAFAAGATRVVVSIALADRPEDLRACVAVAGDWLAVGLDARPDRIAAFPWRGRSAPSLDALLDELAALGVRRFVLSHATAAGDVETLRRTVAARDADVLLAGCGATAAPPSTGPAGPAGSAGGAVSPPAVAGCPTSQPPPLPAGETRTVTISTSLGSIVIEVEGALGPIAAGNFVALASCGYYDGVVFHRVVPGFVIQGGDGQFGREPNIDRDRIGAGGPGYTIEDDPVTATYARGVVAMARTPAPHSQGSQFFIVLTDAARESLAEANTYAILGHVTSGMEVADAIAAAADAEIPSEPVAMDRLTVTSP